MVRTEEDKRDLDGIKLILNGRDTVDVERDLADGVVSKSTLDKIWNAYCIYVQMEYHWRGLRLSTLRNVASTKVVNHSE